MTESLLHQRLARVLFDAEIKLNGDVGMVMNTLENLTVAVIGAMLRVPSSPVCGANFRDVLEVFRENVQRKYRGLDRPDDGIVDAQGQLLPSGKPLL